MDSHLGTKTPFVSYAQNFEDVILWRALRHVSSGCYVDIGAQDPVIDSVSWAFYTQGWRGVHVEPNAGYAQKLRSARRDERVIAAAVGTTAGVITFFEIPDTGLSTGDSAIADAHRAEGFAVNRVDVPCIRLSDIFSSLAMPEIHWLKIDAEGMEREVIASWLPSPVRPWIIVIESTQPNTTISSFSAWEGVVIDLGYEFVYFDGLNRFYVSLQHPELKQSFGPGPNVFDDFTLSGVASAPFCRGLIREGEERLNEYRRRFETADADRRVLESRLQQAELKQRDADQSIQKAVLQWREMEQRALHLVRDVEFWTSKAAQFESELARVYASRSWRITQPLRGGARILRWLRRGGAAWISLAPGSRPMRLARQFFRQPAAAPNHQTCIPVAAEIEIPNAAEAPISSRTRQIHARIHRRSAPSTSGGAAS
jgi:FkbM family methyltransferase